MTLDVTKPTDIDLVNTYAGYLRETRSAIASFVTSKTIDATGLTELIVGTGVNDLSDVPIEIVYVDSTADVTINDITGFEDNQIKIFVSDSGFAVNFSTTGNIVTKDSLTATINENESIAFVDRAGVMQELFRNV
jgi:hypothetical protein